MKRRRKKSAAPQCNQNLRRRSDRHTGNVRTQHSDSRQAARARSIAHIPQSAGQKKNSGAVCGPMLRFLGQKGH
ncbi:hypothetical protein AXK11_07530 [Cephaloticoccus primus]|uniref:Uncharacterized protein n=1 Tax=Cephaloticoccus primus TaxID=1548207 RepID=A0A139SKE7_9BACT|nr:hypothetical protein AXK11_07530 [Cephaloticoccus primus]